MVKEMTFMGIPDPMIWGAYVGCIVSVIFCIGYSIIKSKDPEDESDD